jgi:cellulose synthase/poly-beta-1,6-N-acetylglucosamine synthase-like glycosyltransferase
MEGLLILFIALIFSVIIIFSSYTILYWYYSKKKQPKLKEFFPSITLIVPFYNEEFGIKDKIKDISKIYYKKDKLKILFVNDHSTDKSVEIIKKESKIIPFKVEILNNKGNQGKSNALNYAFKRITTEITAITDADCPIDKNSIKFLAQNFQNEKIGGANAKMVMIKPKVSNKNYNDEQGYRRFYDIWRKGESNLDSISICNGALMSFRTNLIKEIILTSEVDDTELLLEVIKKNFRVVYDSRALVYEVLPTNSSERTKQKMRRIRGVIHVYLKNFKLVGKGKFGSVIYPYTLLTYVISPYLVFLGCLTYLILLFKIPYLFLTLLLFLIPKIGSFARSFIYTQIIMALSPFFAKGWNTTKSSRMGEK